MFQLQCERHRLMNGSDQCSLRASTSEAQDMGNHIESYRVKICQPSVALFWHLKKLGNADMQCQCSDNLIVETSRGGPMFSPTTLALSKLAVEQQDLVTWPRRVSDNDRSPDAP